MKQIETITLPDNTQRKVNVVFNKVTPEIIEGGHNYPKYVDDSENTYIEIISIELVEADREIQKEIDNYFDEYSNEIKEKL